MGLLTLAQMRTEVKSSLGVRTNVLDARYDVWINLAYQDIASAIDWEELSDEHLFDTVPGQQAYPVPTNPITIQLVRDQSTERLLVRDPKDEFYRRDFSESGSPLKWTWRGAQILLQPLPNVAESMLVLYKQTPTNLSDDADITILPPYTDAGIIFLAPAYGLLAMDEDERAIIWANRAINYLSSRLVDVDFSGLLGGLARSQPTERMVSSGG